MTAPAATWTVSGDTVAWRHLLAAPVSARGTATLDAVTVESVTLRVGEGTVSGRGRLALDTMRADGALEVGALSAEALAGPAVRPSLGARLDGNATFAGELAQGLDAVTLAASLRATPAQIRPGTIGIAGDLSVDVSQGQWRVRHRHSLHDVVTIQGDLSGQLAPDLSDTSLGGNVFVAAASGAGLIDLLQRADLTIPEALQPDAGRMDATVSVGGTVGAPTATGRAAVRELSVSGAAPAVADIAFSANFEQLSIDGLEASIGGNTVSGTAVVRLASGVIRGAFDIGARDFRALGPMVSDLQPSGNIGAQVSLAGTTALPDVHATITGTELHLAGQEFSDLSGTLRYRGSTVAAESLVVRQRDGGRLHASGRYETTSGRYDVSLQAETALVSPIEYANDTWPLFATIDGRLSARGTIEHPEGGGHLTVSNVRWEDASLDRADAEITISDAGVRAIVDAPSVALAADALIEPRSPYTFTATARANDSALETFITAIGSAVPPSLAEITGRVRAMVNARGSFDVIENTTADIIVERLDVQTPDASLQLQERATARYMESALSVNALRLRSGGSTIEVTGAIGPAPSTGLSVSLQGDLADVRPWLVAVGVPAELESTGAMTARVHASGSFERLVLDGDARVDGARLNWPGYPPVTDGAVKCHPARWCARCQRACAPR